MSASFGENFLPRNISAIVLGILQGGGGGGGGVSQNGDVHVHVACIKDDPGAGSKGPAWALNSYESVLDALRMAASSN